MSLSQVTPFFSKTEAAQIRDQATGAEQLGCWTYPLLEIARLKKLFHLVVPRVYGGWQLPLPDLLSILEKASALDGSFGWTLTLGAGAGLFAAFMESGIAGSLFADPLAFIAGSGFPGGKAAIHEDGSLSVEGYWKYASGSPHATAFTVNCLITRNGREIKKDGESVIQSVILYPQEVDILPTWKSYGLRATASDDFEVKGLAVPPERCFDITPEASHVDDPLYRYPFVRFAECTLAASLLGIANNFIRRAGILITERHKTGPEQSVQEYAGRVIEHFLNVRHQFHASVKDSWHAFVAERPDAQKLIKSIGPMSRDSVAKALDAAHRLYPYTGMSVLDPDTHLNRAWRDLHTASQHVMLRPEVE